MAHFAKVLDGKVIQVIVAEPEYFQTFVDETPGEWLQCSYNTKGGVHCLPDTTIPSDDQSKALRYNFPGVGYNYDAQADAFYAQQPFDSWSLNKETFIWEPPFDYPKDGNRYKWNEENQSWDIIIEE
jgi:hypothetical protein